MAKRKMFADEERQRAFRLIVAALRNCRHDTEVEIRESHNPNRPTVIQWPGGGLFPDADLTEVAEEVVRQGKEKDPGAAPGPNCGPPVEVEAEVEDEPPRAKPSPAAGPAPKGGLAQVSQVIHLPTPRHFSQRCANDVLSLLDEADRFMTGVMVAEALAAKGIDWSSSTLDHALAELVRREQLVNERGRGGYGLPRWLEENG